ncbi:hypothetical protein D3C86_1841990 [compost metagenome]
MGRGAVEEDGLILGDGQVDVLGQEQIGRGVVDGPLDLGRVGLQPDVHEVEGFSALHQALDVLNRHAGDGRFGHGHGVVPLA